MSLTVKALCRPEVAAGFGLGGLPVAEAADGNEAAKQLRRCAANPDIGVVLVEETLYNNLPEELLRELSRRALPMVVPFPGPVWEARPESAEAYIVELLRQVVGYRVRLT